MRQQHGWAWRHRHVGWFLAVVVLGVVFYFAVLFHWVDNDALTTAAEASAAVGAGLAVYAALRSATESSEAAQRSLKALALARRPRLYQCVEFPHESTDIVHMSIILESDQEDVTDVDMWYRRADGQTFSRQIPYMASATKESLSLERKHVSGPYPEMEVGDEWKVTLWDRDGVGQWSMSGRPGGPTPVLRLTDPQ